MSQARKVIITSAVTGAIHTPSMSKYLPVSPQEIAEAAGVSIGTVRSHMKALFSKTGTHRQAELVALLTRLAMISEEE